MTRERLLAAYNDQVRPAEATNVPTGAVAQVDGPLVRMVGPGGGFLSAPRRLGVDGAQLDALIARQRDFFAARGEPVEWKTRADDEPPGLFDRLRAAGFVPEPTETVMVAPVAIVVAQAAPSPPGTVVRRTADRGDLERIEDMHAEVWGSAGQWAARLGARLEAEPDDEFAVFVAEVGAELVAAAWLARELGTEFAGLWGGSTRQAWRRRGIYRALVARRALLAQSWGVSYLQVDASEDSRPILERIGFVAVTTTTPYVWSPPQV